MSLRGRSQLWCCASGALLSFLCAYQRSPELPLTSDQITSHLQASNDTETQFAYFQRIDLFALPRAVTSIFDLELIPKVSDLLAHKLLERSAAIRQRALTLPCAQREQAFTIVAGIGDKTAHKLAQFLELHQRECQWGESDDNASAIEQEEFADMGEDQGELEASPRKLCGFG